MNEKMDDLVARATAAAHANRDAVAALSANWLLDAVSADAGVTIEHIDVEAWSAPSEACFEITGVTDEVGNQMLPHDVMIAVVKATSPTVLSEDDLEAEDLIYDLFHDALYEHPMLYPVVEIAQAESNKRGMYVIRRMPVVKAAVCCEEGAGFAAPDGAMFCPFCGHLRD
jgi:hypothetical protein